MEKLTAEQPLGRFSGLGPLGLENKFTGDAPEIFATIISNIVGLMTVIGAIWFLVQIIIAGLQWLSAGDDKQKLAGAKSKLGTSIIGFGIVVLAIVIARIMARLLKVDIVFDPVTIIEILKPGP